jgi:hypothetical protein
MAKPTNMTTDFMASIMPSFAVPKRCPKIETSGKTETYVSQKPILPDTLAICIKEFSKSTYA